MAGGRPSSYSHEVAEKLCSTLARGVSLRTACKEPDMPCIASVFNWFRKHPGFLEQYEKAKEESADALIEDMLDIADDGTNDWIENNGDDDAKKAYKLNGENVQRSRLRVDTRKWAASKLKPKKYGEKIDLSHTGKDGGSIQIEVNRPKLTKEEWIKAHGMGTAKRSTE